MAKAKTSKTEAPGIKDATDLQKQQAASLKFRPHLLKAVDLLNRASLQLRLFAMTFDEHSTPRFSTAEAARVAQDVRQLLEEASEELFSTGGDEPEYAMANKALHQLWSAFAVVALCCETLAAGNFGDGGSILECPVELAMQTAEGVVTRLRAPLDRYVAALPKPAKAAA